MDILDMSLRQILHGITLVKFLEACSGILVLESIVRSVAVNKGYKNVADWCDRLADIATFILNVFSAIKSKMPPPAAPAAIILLCVGLLFATGCASYNQKAVCLQLGTTNASIPYVGGATSGSGFACYYSCLGSTCPAPVAKTMTDLMNTEATAANNSIITSGPVKITAIPIK